MSDELSSDDDTDSLTLKWQTLKAWAIKSPAARTALTRYGQTGRHSAGAMSQNDTPEQKAALCDLIDALNCEEVFIDWDGKYVSKQAAKDYVMGREKQKEPEQCQTN